MTQKRKVEQARERALQQLNKEFITCMNTGTHVFAPLELLTIMQELLIAYYWEVFGDEHVTVLGGTQLPQPQFRLNINDNWCQGWLTPRKGVIREL